MSSGSSRQHGLGRLVDRYEVGGGLVRHVLLPPPSFAASYGHPGQYVSLALAGKDTYFVLASEPGDPTWEVLVRAGGDVADALLALPVEGEVEVSSAIGEGFPLHEAAGRTLFVLAAGSGVAAIRPVLSARVQAGQAVSTEVLVGVRTVEEVPLANELMQRRGEGVGVTLCISRPAASLDGRPKHALDYAKGYVQNVLLERAPRHAERIKGAMIFAAGASSMIEGVRQVARTLGVAEADVRTNY